MKTPAAVLTTCHAGQPFGDSKPIEIREVDLADPTGKMVLVEVMVAGLCHSDLSVVNGSRERPVPLVLGHEASGRVVKVGPDVQGVAAGDRVTFTFQPACGECDLCVDSGGERCAPALEANVAGTLLHGERFLSENGEPLFHHSNVAAFANFTVVHQSSVIKVDDDVPFEIAALLGCAVTTGGGAVMNAARVREGERVAIVGAGGVGLSALLVARAFDAAVVDVVEPAASKHEILREFGATNIVTPDTVQREHYDVVIEAAGVKPAFEMGVTMLRPGGRLVSVGLPHPDATAEINILDVVFKSKQIIGSYHGSGDPNEDLKVYVDLWRQGKLELEKLVTKRIGLDGLNEALDDLQHAREIRQLIMIGEEK